MSEDALSGFRCFYRPNRPGDLGAEDLDLIAHGGTHSRNNGPGIVGATIYHGEQNAVNVQPGIDLPSHPADGAQQQVQALGGQVVGLGGNDDPICGNQGIDGHKPQGRHAVNDDVVVVVLQPLQNISHNRFPAQSIDQHYFHTGQFDITGEQIHTLFVPDDAIVGRKVHAR